MKPTLTFLQIKDFDKFGKLFNEQWKIKSYFQIKLVIKN